MLSKTLSRTARPPSRVTRWIRGSRGTQLMTLRAIEMVVEAENVALDAVHDELIPSGVSGWNAGQRRVMSQHGCCCQ
eukprot:3460885-Rhodomonas_salina.3